MKIKITGKIIVFLLIGILIVNSATSFMGISNEYSEHAEMVLNGYYDLDQDSSDVVFVGNSHVYRYWQCAFAWKEYGLSSAALATSDMPYCVVKNMVIEALKTQSPKVVVIDATAFANKEQEVKNKIYLLLNNMHHSANYYDMIANFCYYSDIEGLDQLQYYFPLVQFHERWKELSIQDFVQTQPSYLNSCYQEKFLTSTIQGKNHNYTEEKSPIAEGCEDALRDFLEWCQEADCKVLFYGAPVLKSKDYLECINYVLDIAQEYGADTIDFNDEGLFESFGFVLDKDFQDTNHTNIVGSYKFTRGFALWLMEEYGLTSHSGEAGYEEWDEQAEEYYNLVIPYMEAIDYSEE